MNDPMITVSIVTYRTPVGELDACLRSLGSKSIDTIYIIDNGNEPRIARWSENRPRVVYMGGRNVGYGAGHNKILRTTRAKYHIVMNSDVEFQPDIIDKMLAYMESHPEVAQLHPRVVHPNGQPQFTARRLPGPAIVWARRFLPNALIRRPNNRYMLKHLDLNKPLNVPNHQGSFLFQRVADVREAGLFDERFFLYAEDMDLTRRLHRNHVTLYWPMVTITHIHHAASYKSLRMTWLHCVSLIRYFNKWGWLSDEERRRFNAPLR